MGGHVRTLCAVDRPWEWPQAARAAEDQQLIDVEVSRWMPVSAGRRALPGLIEVVSRLSDTCVANATQRPSECHCHGHRHRRGQRFARRAASIPRAGAGPAWDADRGDQQLIAVIAATLRSVGGIAADRGRPSARFSAGVARCDATVGERRATRPPVRGRRGDCIGHTKAVALTGSLSS